MFILRFTLISFYATPYVFDALVFPLRLLLLRAWCLLDLTDRLFACYMLPCQNLEIISVGYCADVCLCGGICEITDRTRPDNIQYKKQHNLPT